jgi:hypothetical protein
MRKYHVGRRASGDESDNAYELFKDSTRRLDDRAFWAKVCDVVEGSLDKIKFAERVEAFKRAASKNIEQDPVKAVEELANQLTFTDTERGSVLSHLITGGDLSQWGLANAVTRTATDLPDYDRAVEFERFGGQIIELPKQSWEAISNAA